MKQRLLGLCVLVVLVPADVAAAGAERVTIGGSGVALSAMVFSPEATPDSRRPAVVLLHGCEGLTNDRGEVTKRHREWAELFARWGYVALLVDSFKSRGVGSLCSLKDRPIQPWDERNEDAYAALDYLVRRPDVDPRRIVALGWSNGGATVLGLVRRNAPGRRADGPRFKAAIAYYPSCARPLRQEAQYRPTVPLLILIGAQDDWTPAEPCVALAEKLRTRGFDVRTIVYPGAYHAFDAGDDRIRFRPDVHNPASPSGRGAHSGGHARARAEAIEDTKRFLDRHIDAGASR